MFIDIAIVKPAKSQVVVFFRQRLFGSHLKFFLVLIHQSWIDLDFRRSQSRRGNEFQVWVASQLTRKPQERFFKVIIAFSRNIIVLQILFAMESDWLGLNFSFLKNKYSHGQKSTSTLISTLLPQRTIGIFSQTRTKSRCQLGTFLYVMREVTSNIMMAHLPLILNGLIWTGQERPHA